MVPEYTKEQLHHFALSRLEQGFRELGRALATIKRRTVEHRQSSVPVVTKQQRQPRNPHLAQRLSRPRARERKDRLPNQRNTTANQGTRNG